MLNCCLYFAFIIKSLFPLLPEVWLFSMLSHATRSSRRECPAASVLRGGRLSFKVKDCACLQVVWVGRTQSIVGA